MVFFSFSFLGFDFVRNVLDFVHLCLLRMYYVVSFACVCVCECVPYVSCFVHVWYVLRFVLCVYCVH